MRIAIRYAGYGVAAILLAVPFQAFLTTWLGAEFGYIDMFRIWKELLLIPVTFLALYLMTKKSAALTWLTKTRLLQLVAVYIGLHVVLGLIAFSKERVTAEALIYALLINTRLLIFFVVGLLVASYDDWLVVHWRKLVIYPAIIVILFGLAQIWLLPPDFLKHFGYGESTIPAVHTIDQKLEYQRIQSTLRGPNPLGAYLVIVLTLTVWRLTQAKLRRHREVLFGLASMIALYYTYSRSAWLGTAFAVATVIWLRLPDAGARRRVLIGASVLVVGFAGLTFALKNNDRFQNVVFHTDENSRSADSSNADRSSSLKSGAQDLINEPWGRGPGTAGPASFRNDGNEARIAENYFLQIGQEVGVLGVVLFIGINLLVVFALWSRGGQLAVVLVASWTGLTLINLLSHAWADDTLAYVWWGLAGIALAQPKTISSVILNKKRKATKSQYAQTQA